MPIGKAIVSMQHSQHVGEDAWTGAVDPIAINEVNLYEPTFE